MPNIFISHSWEHSQDYANLKNLLDNRGYFYYRNHSVPLEDPFYGNRTLIWDQITNNIKWSSIVILIAGVYATYSGSMKREIDIARQYCKPILAVIPRGNEYASSLRYHANRVVGWNTETIIQAIRELS
jgi:hypothetical protein